MSIPLTATAFLLVLMGLCGPATGLARPADAPAFPTTAILAEGRPRLSATEVQARLSDVGALTTLPPLDTSAEGRSYAYRHVLRWYATDWTNRSVTDSNWVVRLRHTYAFDVEAWVGRVDRSGRVLSWQQLHGYGQALPPSRHQLVWALGAAPGERLVLLYHGGSIFGGPELLTREAYQSEFLAEEVWAQAILYVFLAFAGFFLLYNGVLFYTVRQRVFVHYGVYVLCMSCYMWFSSHVAGQWFAERVALPGYNYLAAGVLFLGLYGFTRYSRSFISADAVAPHPSKLFSLVSGLMLLNFGLGIANLWLRNASVNGLYNALIGVALLLVVVASLWAGWLGLRRRAAEAWPYVLGSALPLVTCVVVAFYLLSGKGVGDLKQIMPMLYPGFVVEYLLLSMALGAYIRQTERQRDHAQAETIAALEQNQQLIAAQNVELERRVTERTQALESSNQRLSLALEELRSTQEQLIAQEKQAALAQVLSGLAHEMNTPIGVCVTAASNLSERAQNVVDATKAGNLTRSELDRFAGTASELSQSLVTNLQRVSGLIHDAKQLGLEALDPLTTPPQSSS